MTDVYTLNTATNNSAADQQARFITIEGPIGIGKSTLAKRISERLQLQPLLEQESHNPFLESFYQNPKQNALATQLFFLFQRMQLLQQHQGDDLFGSAYVSDFLIDKDKIFAEAVLSNEEYEIYKKVFAQSVKQTPKPDLVVYLQAPADVLMQRLQQQGKHYEQQISLQYLEQINEAYSQFFHYYDDAPLLIINAAQVDLINDENAFNGLINYMLSIQNGRHYFNPSFFTEAYA